MSYRTTGRAWPQDRRRWEDETPFAKLYPVDGALALETNYNPHLVDDLKDSVPKDDRTFDKATRRWLIAPQHGATVVALVQRHLGIRLDMPAAKPSNTATKILEVRYIGRCKERDGGAMTAWGWMDGGWKVIFSEKVLREWFESGLGLPERPGQNATYYSVLGVKADASEAEIRSGYRRMARQWHPDVCKEPDATAVFKQIQSAYEVLSNPASRRKYDAGLALQAATQPHALGHRQVDLREGTYNFDGQLLGYRSPLRCGWILVEGTEILGRFHVAKILAWEDITDRHGRVLVTSWPAGSDTFVETWQ